MKLLTLLLGLFLLSACSPEPAPSAAPESEAEEIITFENSDYSIRGEEVYFEEEKVEGADAESFEIIASSDEYDAEDKNVYYLDGKVVEQEKEVSGRNTIDLLVEITNLATTEEANEEKFTFLKNYQKSFIIDKDIHISAEEFPKAERIFLDYYADSVVLQDIADIQMYHFDFNSDGKDEYIYVSPSPSLGKHIDYGLIIFQEIDGKWEKVFDFDEGEGMRSTRLSMDVNLVDIDKNGDYEVQVIAKIDGTGAYLSSSILKWKENKIQRIKVNFPDRYSEHNATEFLREGDVFGPGGIGYRSICPSVGGISDNWCEFRQSAQGSTGLLLFDYVYADGEFKAIHFRRHDYSFAEEVYDLLSE